MNSRREIWSVPLALALVLIFAAVLGVSQYVQAQTPESPPVTATPFVDTEITLQTERSAASNADPETQTTLADAFSDTTDSLGTADALAYTALSTDNDVVEVSLNGNADIAILWWNRLGAVDADGEIADPDLDCTKRMRVLGFTLAEDANNDGTTDHAPDVAGNTPAIARGLCNDYTELTEAADAVAGLEQQQLVVQAFHWDMLTGLEMEYAAKAGKLPNPASYKVGYSGLTKDQRERVAGLYDIGVLARGNDTFTFTNRGSDAITGTGDDEMPNPGVEGEATVTVKASDNRGRFLGDSVGRSFDVTVVPQELAPISINRPETPDSVGYVGLDGDGDVVDDPDDSDTSEYGDVDVLQLTITGGATTVATITVAPTGLSSAHQKINFSLTDGNNLPFQIQKIDMADLTPDDDTHDPIVQYNRAEVRVRPGVTLSESSYEFNLSANELGNAAANSDSKAIKILVAVDNTAPSFDASQSSGVSVPEAAKDHTIATFSASDPNNQVLSYSIAGKSDDPNAVLIVTNKLLVMDAVTGVLKTSKTAGLDYQELLEENIPETTYDDTKPDNEHVFIITVSDGTLSDTHELTITVTDVDDPPPGQQQKLSVKEDNAGGVDNFFGKAPALESSPGVPASGDWTMGQQIDNQGNIANEENPEDILFAIEPGTGKVYLDEDKVGELDFESGIITYTLSFNRGNSSGIIVVTVDDVNEGPKFHKDDHDRYDLENTSDDNEIVLYVLESAAVGSIVKIGKDAGGNPATINAIFGAMDEDTKAAFRGTAYDLWYDADTTDDDDEFTDAYAGAVALFTVDSSGAVKVNVALDTDADDSLSSISLKLRAYDTTEDIPDPVDEDDETPAELRRVLKDVLPIRIEIIDTNVAPEFDAPSRLLTHATVSEGAAVGTVVHTYLAEDEDGDTVRYRLRDQDDAPFFSVEETLNAANEEIGVLKTAAGLDYEISTSHTVEIQAYDTDGDTDEIVITVDVSNANDNSPVFNVAPSAILTVAENTPRGVMLGSYAATDADGDVVTYSLSGTNAKSFHIDGDGNVKTLESLDYDSNTPCSVGGCSVTVVASDANAASGEPVTGHDGPSEAAVTISVLPIEDSVSTLNVTKANPVPGTTRGDPMTALGNTKTSISDAVPERPADLPNKTGAPLNFVETDWANWGTVLRIEVTSQSPDATCDGGNECVIINLNSDSADDTLQIKAYRMDTPAGAASNENKFVAAVMLVEVDGDATDIKTSANVDIPVYKHGDGTVARLQVDEEDEIEVEFGNLRGDIDVENEAPEIGNFAPEHESAFDDPDVEYTFTVTDSHSGLPEPEDLPDPDGDDSYMPVVALISKGQCETADQDASAASKARRAKLINDGFEVVGDMANISDDESLYCPGVEQDGEYDASGAGYGFAPIRDDKDFDEIDDGFDVETTIVLRENRIFYVTFVACDAAGNCSFYDPDGNDEAEELAEITVDTEDPVFVEARTGLTWDSTGNEYDDNRSYIQVIFNDLTKLNTETVEIDDFVVEGHSIKDVQVYENPDDDDVTWSDSGRYGAAGSKNKRGVDRYRDLENVVFIELEDELLADETPDVTIVPNGVEDKAGNEQDDGDHEADDWISPEFTIVSIVSTRETSQDQVLAGDDDEVTVVVTSDERLDSTRPTVLVTYVNAPAGSVDTKGVALCDTKAGADEGTRERGEIVHTGNDDCADSDAAKGGNLNNNVEKVSNTEWIVTITEPKATGYYNFRIEGNDRSPQENPGSEGVSPKAIVTDFFDADGDVNVDDAIFFEGDINLPKPNVRVSGVSVDDNEADVEFRSPLFVELDFASNHSDNCRNVDSDERMSNCMNENSEYAEDNFDDIVVTSFVLDGVDITDSVKTTDNQSFLVSLESISIGDHTAELQAVDQAGNVFEDTLEIDFEVNDRDPFEKRLSPGWNLVSLPGEPADSSIASVFGPGVEVRTVYTYDPVIPGGWQVAVRETLDSDWQGDLTEINGQRGYWVLSDAIQDWEVSIPRLSGGAAGTGTPIQPPVIPLYAGWNLIPVTDISGNGAGGDTLSADVYLQSLDDGIDLARVLGFDTIRNQWETVLDPDMQMNNTLEIGAGYWIFVREATSLVPSGYVGGGGGGD